MKIEDVRVNEFRMLIKPLSLGMQLGGIFLVAVTWLLADDSYKYDIRQISLFLALTMISIGASWKIPFFLTIFHYNSLADMPGVCFTCRPKHQSKLLDDGIEYWNISSGSSRFFSNQ